MSGATDPMGATDVARDFVRAALTTTREAREVRAEWAQAADAGRMERLDGADQRSGLTAHRRSVVPTGDLASAHALNGTDADRDLERPAGKTRSCVFTCEEPACFHGNVGEDRKLHADGRPRQ